MFTTHTAKIAGKKKISSSIATDTTANYEREMQFQKVLSDHDAIPSETPF